MFTSKPTGLSNKQTGIEPPASLTNSPVNLECSSVSVEHQRARCGTACDRCCQSSEGWYIFTTSIWMAFAKTNHSSRFKLIQAKTPNQTSSRRWHSSIERELESILSLSASTFSGQRALSFDRQRVQIISRSQLELNLCILHIDNIHF